MNILIIEDEAIAAERMQQMVKDNIPDAVIVGVCCVNRAYPKT